MHLNITVLVSLTQLVQTLYIYIYSDGFKPRTQHLIILRDEFLTTKLVDKKEKIVMTSIGAFKNKNGCLLNK